MSSHCSVHARTSIILGFFCAAMQDKLFCVGQYFPIEVQYQPRI